VGADPGLLGELSKVNVTVSRKSMVRRQYHAQRVVEEGIELDPVNRFCLLEVVVEEDCDVEAAVPWPAQRRGPVDQLVHQDNARVLGVEACANLRRQVHQRGEEGAESNGAALQAGELADLGLGLPNQAELRIVSLCRSRIRPASVGWTPCDVRSTSVVPS
jgi:hypothetical protein